MIMYKKDPRDPQDKFFYLLKENATSCNIRMHMQSVNVSARFIGSVMNIKDFYDPIYSANDE